jgi:uncharacterized protein YndB with AHSA1/START domain
MSEHRHDICLRLHLDSRPERVFDLFATDQGRESFWVSKCRQQGDLIRFSFPNGESLVSRILESSPVRRFSFTYFQDSVVTVELIEVADGTDLVLREAGVPAEFLVDNRAGWVSVLLNLKARADHGVDLRNHDPARTWTTGYVDN